MEKKLIWRGDPPPPDVVKAWEKYAARSTFGSEVEEAMVRRRFVKAAQMRRYRAKKKER